MNAAEALPAYTGCAPAMLGVPNWKTYSTDDDGTIRSGMLYKWNCNQIRNKIKNLIQSGEIKVTHFQREIGISSASYCRFMKMKGPASGCYNETYSAAHSFFEMRERAGIKEAKPRKATSAEVEQYNVDHIALEGECEEDVPVYDTCDDVRRKIRAHLRKPGVTQASFCREIAKTYHRATDSDKKIQSTQLTKFLAQKGPTSGNMSVVYYGAYVYFEKMRIKNGTAKTEKRLEIEAEYLNGMDRKTNFAVQHYIGSADRELYMDNLGRLFVQ